ncbi:MAG: hypothetical protein HXY20_10975 [Acidobacteria bacterium]|nr:hypothetical protein [Acidobacteriota bacterium]
MARSVCGWLAGISLAGCLAAPVLYIIGYVEAGTYRNILAVMSLSWFVFASAWAGRSSGQT